METNDIIKYNNYPTYLEEVLSYLDDQRQVNIKIQLMELLQEQSSHYTNNSTLSKETMQSLMDHLIYIISLYLKQYDLNKAINLLQNQTIDNLHHQANDYLIKLLQQTTLKLDELLKQLIKVDLIVYHDTLFIALKAALNHYNYRYFAQENLLTYDYPSFCRLSNNQGIERYLEYLHNISIENNFNQIFKDEITEMLKYYQKGYQYLIFNISYLLLKQLLLKDITNSNEHHLYLNDVQINQIYQIFTIKDISTTVNHAFNNIANKYHFNNELYNYLIKRIDEIIQEFEFGVKHHCLISELSYHN